MSQPDLIWERIQRETADFEKAVADVGLYHRGYRFWPPYACGRCGCPISARQFAFARCCGGCDNGNSRTARWSIDDKRWFILGKAVLENADDNLLIHPEFIDAKTAETFPRLYRPLKKPAVPKSPKLPKPRRWS